MRTIFPGCDLVDKFDLKTGYNLLKVINLGLPLRGTTVLGIRVICNPCMPDNEIRFGPIRITNVKEIANE